jgi:hypothetical protein
LTESAEREERRIAHEVWKKGIEEEQEMKRKA